MPWPVEVVQLRLTPVLDITYLPSHVVHTYLILSLPCGRYCFFGNAQRLAHALMTSAPPMTLHVSEAVLNRAKVSIMWWRISDRITDRVVSEPLVSRLPGDRMPTFLAVVACRRSVHSLTCMPSHTRACMPPACGSWRQLHTLHRVPVSGDGYHSDIPGERGVRGAQTEGPCS